MTYKFYRTVNYKPFIKHIEKAFHNEGKYVRYINRHWMLFLNNEFYSVELTSEGYIIYVLDFDTDSGELFTDMFFDSLENVKEFIENDAR